MRPFSCFTVGLLVLLAGACGSDPPTFPPLELDSGLECSSSEPGADASSSQSSDLGPCPTGEVCLSGRCYDECSGDAECAATEACDNGVCLPRSGPRPDSGMPDTGPVEPCDGVTCDDPLMCHPTGGVCVECLGPPCPGGAPVCDIAVGACVVFRPRPCAPCNVDGDCVDAMTAMDFGDCVMGGRDFERVCMLPCTMNDECPTGLQCNADGRCAPRVGQCTGFANAVDNKSCMVDTDCVPLGAAAADGQCYGVMMGADGGAPTPGVCRQPCGLMSDCPAGAMCIGGFCLPP